MREGSQIEWSAYGSGIKGKKRRRNEGQVIRFLGNDRRKERDKFTETLWP
jgi:hypothetical protein